MVRRYWCIPSPIAKPFVGSDAIFVKYTLWIITLLFAPPTSSISPILSALWSWIRVAGTVSDSVREGYCNLTQSAESPVL